MKRENAWSIVGIVLGFVGAVVLYKLDKATAMQIGEVPLFFGGPLACGVVGYLLGLKKT